MAKTLRKFLKSFTLIELIIVIAIIAVLGTAAFLLLTQWMSKGRDAQRISDLSTIKTALDIGYVKNGQLPIPDEKNDLEYSGSLILYQGKFGQTVVNELGSLNKIPTDRTFGLYDYSLVSDNKTYMIRAKMEDDKYSFTPKKGEYVNTNIIFSKVGAQSFAKYKFLGKELKGIIVLDKFIYLPSMFATGYVNNKIDLQDRENVFEGENPGTQLSGFAVDKNNKTLIEQKLTDLGIGTSDINTIISQSYGVSIAQTTPPIVQEVSCGTSNGIIVSNTPTDNLCSYGTASTVNYDLGKGQYNWTCSDVESVSCKAYDDKSIVLMHYDNTIEDSFGANVTKFGTITNSSSIYKLGSGSLYFDGSNDYITLANKDSFNIGNEDFTVDFWIKTTSTAQDYILSRSASGNYLDFAIDIGGASSPGKIRLLASELADNAYCISMTSTITVNDNQWHHIAMVRSGTSAYLYIDGVERGTDTTATCNVNLSTSDLYIGKDNYIPEYNRYFNGYLDEFRFSKIARYQGPFTVYNENY